MKIFRYILLILALLIFIAGCDKIKMPQTKKPDWIKLPTNKLGIGSEGYFTTVTVSTVSLKDAESKAGEELGALIFNLFNEYVKRVNPTVKTEIDPLLIELVERQIKEASLGAKEYFEIRDRFSNKREKKYYIFGGIKSEQLLREITTRIEKIYNPDNLLAMLKEKNEIYRVKVSSRYDDQIVTLLQGASFVVDNSNWHGQIIGSSNVVSSSSLKSLSGTLWTIKANYTITISDKKGKTIGRITSSEGTGVHNSKEEAKNKALVQTAVDINRLSNYFPALKDAIESYLKDAISNSIVIVEKVTRNYYADALKYFESSDYQSTLILLEGIHILNKSFPQALVLYLRAKGNIIASQIN